MFRLILILICAISSGLYFPIQPAYAARSEIVHRISIPKKLKRSFKRSILACQLSTTRSGERYSLVEINPSNKRVIRSFRASELEKRLKNTTSDFKKRRAPKNFTLFRYATDLLKFLISVSLACQNLENSPTPTATPTPTGTGGQPTPSATSTPTPTPTPTPSNSPTPIIQAGVPPNTLTIGTGGLVPTSNQPIQFGRAFVKGEIPNCPHLYRANGTTPLYQQTVLNRYEEDGSVAFAVIQMVTDVPGGSPEEFRFTNIPCPSTTPVGLTAQEMLGGNFNFDAEIELRRPASSQISRASARAMLQAGNFTYYLRGPVATSIILADHSIARSADLGWDSLRPIRPMFEVTFWPTLNKVQVRFIGENTNTIALQDTTYDLRLYTGQNNRTQVYSQNGIMHYVLTRWSRHGYWIGGPPATVHIDHNIDYLKHTPYLPRFRSQQRPSAQAISNSCAEWTSTPRAIGDAGGWMTPMPSSGGRADLGWTTGWAVNALYAGNACLWDRVFRMADLAGAWPIHLREGAANRSFDWLGTSALGRVVTNYARRTFVWFNDTRVGTTPADEVPVTDTRFPPSIWINDTAHKPDPFSVAYLVTGERYYLESLQFWASYGILRPKSGQYSEGRGPGNFGGGWGTGGHIDSRLEETRGWAWNFARRVMAAKLSPDGSPEQNLFDNAVHEALAFDEGARNIQGTVLDGTLMKQTGLTLGLLGTGTTWPQGDQGNWGRLGLPLVSNSWDTGWEPNRGIPVVTIATSHVALPWQQNLVIIVLGQAKKLGYPAAPLLAWAGRMPIELVTHPDSNPSAVASYYMPVRDANGWYTSMRQIMNNYQPAAMSSMSASFDNEMRDPMFGFPVIALAAASYLTDLPGGRQTYDYILSRIEADPTAFARVQANSSWYFDPQ